MRNFTIALLLVCSFSIVKSQNNSQPYIGKSLIKIHSSNTNIADHLLEFNVIPVSCRGSILESNLITLPVNSSLFLLNIFTIN